MSAPVVPDLLSFLTCSDKRKPKPETVVEAIQVEAGCCKMPKMQADNVKTVAGFLEGAAVFAISRMWADMISAFLLHLASVPYCGGFIEQPCVGTAESTYLFIYALCTIPACGLIKHLAEDSGLTENKLGMLDNIPDILNYIVGWAWGNALQQLLLEIEEAHPDLLGVLQADGRLNFFWFNAAYSLVASLVAGCVVIFIKPYTQEVECGKQTDPTCERITNWIEDLIEDVWAMVSRGCSVIVMVLWYYTINNALFFYVPTGTSTSHPLAIELQTLYAIGISSLGATVSTKLELWEIHIKGRGWRPAQVESLVGFSDLTQSTIGYVVGCACSDTITTVFTSLNAAPTPDVLVKNILITGALTAAVVYYLLVANASYELTNAADRDATERYFTVNSAAFFVGWTWLVVSRNLFAQFALALEFGFDEIETRFDLNVPKGLADVVAVLLYSPVLTAFFFWASASIMTQIHKRTNTYPKEKKPKEGPLGFFKKQRRVKKEELV